MQANTRRRSHTSNVKNTETSAWQHATATHHARVLAETIIHAEPKTPLESTSQAALPLLPPMSQLVQQLAQEERLSTTDLEAMPEPRQLPLVLSPLAQTPSRMVLKWHWTLAAATASLLCSPVFSPDLLWSCRTSSSSVHFDLICCIEWPDSEATCLDDTHLRWFSDGFEMDLVLAFSACS